MHTLNSSGSVSCTLDSLLGDVLVQHCCLVCQSAEQREKSQALECSERGCPKSDPLIQYVYDLLCTGVWNDSSIKNDLPAPPDILCYYLFVALNGFTFFLFYFVFIH